MPCVALAKQGGAIADTTSYAWQAMQFNTPMFYVYLIRSETTPSQTYIGLTDDLTNRLQIHNEGSNKHTSKFKPWKLECYIALATKEKAAEFERYLKHGSGHAFAKRHFWGS